MPSKKKKYNARFPPARIKKIMQTDEEVGKVAAAVPVIISRSLEMFVESLIEKTAVITKAKNAKTLSASHIKQTIHSEKTFDFLHDLVANIPDHVVEDEGDGIVATATVATGATAETKPRKIYRARKPREDGKRGPGRPRKVDMVKESNSASGTASENDEESDGADEDTTLTTDPLRDSAQGRPDPQQWSVASVQPAGQAESQPRVPAELHPSSYAVPVPSQPVPTSPSPDIPNGPPPFTRHPAWSPASDPPVPGPGPKMAASPTTSGLVTNPPTATQFSPQTTTNIQFPPHVPMNKQFSPQTTNTDVISPPVMSTVTTRPQQAPQFFPHMLSSMVYPPTHSPMGGPPPLFVPPAGLPMSPGLRPAMFTSPPLPYGTGPRVPSASYGNNEDCQPLDMSLSGAARSQKLCRQDASEDVKIAGGVSSSKPSIFHRPFLNDHPIANNIHNVPQSKLTAVEEHGLSQRGRQDHSVGTLDPPSKGADPGVPRMNSATSSGGVPALAYAGLASLMTQAAHIPVSNDSDDYDI